MEEFFLFNKSDEKKILDEIFFLLFLKKSVEDDQEIFEEEMIDILSLDEILLLFVLGDIDDLF